MAAGAGGWDVLGAINGGVHLVCRPVARLRGPFARGVNGTISLCVLERGMD